MKLAWLIVAGLCITLAAVFMLRSDFTTAFLIATVGMVAWFLNYRMQLKELTATTDTQQDEHRETEDLDDQ